MARQLKADLLRLQQVFPKNHDRFRVLTASADELMCRFIRNDKSFFDIQANITDSYPSEPPLWFIISDDAAIIDLLEKPLETFNDAQERENRIVNQVVTMVHLLCSECGETLPTELDQLNNTHSLEEHDEDTGNESDELSDEMEDGDDDFDSENEYDNDNDNDEIFVMDASMSSVKSHTTENDIDAENAVTLRKQKNLQYENKSVDNSSCSKVLLKELDTIYRSETFKKKTYSVELIDDKLNTWNVNLMSVCPDSLLHSDLIQLKQQGFSGNIEMRITFEETFPYSPPFIQVTYPAIKGGHVLDQGALCMELLTKQGWSSAYSMENVLIQILSTLITGQARVDFEKTKVILENPYNQDAARKMFEYHEHLHERNGISDRSTYTYSK